MNSINLLPNSIKEEYESSKKNRGLFNALLSTLFVSAMLLVILFISKTYLSMKFASLEKDLVKKEESIKKYGALETEAQRLEGRLKAAKSVIGKKVFFSKVLDQVRKATPSQVYVQTVEMDKDTTKRGSITGSAENKIVLASFLKLLENTEAFEYVDLENTERTTDPFLITEKENFKLTFILNSKELNEKP